MSRRVFKYALVSFISILITFLVFSILNFSCFNKGYGETQTAYTQAIKFQEAFSQVAKNVGPAVVSVLVKKKITVAVNPMFDDDFFKRFFGIPALPRERRKQYQEAFGSGFIIDDEGHILSNNHVVEDADKITIKLSNGMELPAKVLSTDKKTDLALLKIKLPTGIPFVRLGDSDKLKVGEWAIAIGNPFNIGQTVSVGVISGKGRTLRAADIENYIQTDASINPGNSGGPLCNIKGEVIGINSAIYSTSGGNIGIGFAIPINLVKKFLPEMKKGKKVSHPWVGIYIQDIDKKIADALGLEFGKGVLVPKISKDSPAERAGIKTGDIILKVNNTDITSSHQLQIEITKYKVGESVEFLILRKGKKKTITVKLGKMPDDISDDNEISQSNNEDSKLWLGMKTVEKGNDVVVSSVKDGSPAFNADIRAGDIIRRIDNYDIESIDDFNNAIKAVKNKDAILVLRERNGVPSFVTIEK